MTPTSFGFPAGACAKPTCGTPSVTAVVAAARRETNCRRRMGFSIVHPLSGPENVSSPPIFNLLIVCDLGTVAPPPSACSSPRVAPLPGLGARSTTTLGSRNSAAPGYAVTMSVRQLIFSHLMSLARRSVRGALVPQIRRAVRRRDRHGARRQQPCQHLVHLREHHDDLVRFQKEQASAAASKISQFIKEIEGQLGWMTHLVLGDAGYEQRELDGLRLLRQVPAITELALLDDQGREQLRFSRQAKTASAAASTSRPTTGSRSPSPTRSTTARSISGARPSRT